MADRLWRYKVDEVWGFASYETPPIAVGEVLIDRWKADRTWHVYDFAKGLPLVGGWHARLLGEYTGERDEKGAPVMHEAP